MTRQKSRTGGLAMAALAALPVCLRVYAAPAVFAQAGGSDRMPGGVEARPSRPEASRGIPAPAPAAIPTPPPPPAPDAAPKPKAAEATKPAETPDATEQPKKKKSAPRPSTSGAPRAPESTPHDAAKPGAAERGGGTDQIPGGVEHRKEHD
jgi:outer membrane biosynthesis protein TonB